MFPPRAQFHRCLRASRLDRPESAPRGRPRSTHPVGVGPGVLTERPADRLAQEELAFGHRRLDRIDEQPQVGVGAQPELADDRRRAAASGRRPDPARGPPARPGPVAASSVARRLRDVVDHVPPGAADDQVLEQRHRHRRRGHADARRERAAPARRTTPRGGSRGRRAPGPWSPTSPRSGERMLVEDGTGEPADLGHRDAVVWHRRLHVRLHGGAFSGSAAAASAPRTADQLRRLGHAVTAGLRRARPSPRRSPASRTTPRRARGPARADPRGRAGFSAELVDPRRDRRPRSRRVVGRVVDEQPGLAVDHDLGDAADRAGHHGGLAGHRLEVDDAQRLVDRRAHEHHRVRQHLPDLSRGSISLTRSRRRGSPAARRSASSISALSSGVSGAPASSTSCRPGSKLQPGREQVGHALLPGDPADEHHVGPAGSTPSSSSTSVPGRGVEVGVDAVVDHVHPSGSTPG